MKVTWLGQAGLYFEMQDLTVMIDPYLSDSVGKVNPANRRRVPVDESLFDLRPDVLIFTHSHLDHYDPETAERFLRAGKPMTVLAPSSVWGEVRKVGCGHNYVLFDRLTEWSERSVRFLAVRAVHSDPSAIGVVLEDLREQKTYYVTGDTLYNRAIFADLPERIDTVFLPVNGAGNNMNMTDAARFADRTGAKAAVPLHIGLFDSLDAADFRCAGKVIPDFYKPIPLP